MMWVCSQVFNDVEYVIVSNILLIWMNEYRFVFVKKKKNFKNETYIFYFLFIQMNYTEKIKNESLGNQIPLMIFGWILLIFPKKLILSKSSIHKI